jgi:predicted Zn-dependent protease
MERLVPRRLIATAVLCAVALAAAARPLPPPDQELLHNARFWEAHDRGDLAQLALRKLVAARPDIPEPLAELGELDLRMNDFQAAAEVENALERRFPESVAARDFATEVRVATRDRLQFASIRRLVEIDRIAEVKAALDRLFPHGAPGGTLGIEYWLLLGRTPGGAAAAHAGLERLANAHPGDPRYQLALAQLMVREADTALEGVKLLDTLTQRDDVRTVDADRVLASGLLRLGPGQAPESILAGYLARNPQDTELVALHGQQQGLRQEHELQSDATAARALPALQRRIAADLASGTVPRPARAAVADWLSRSRASLAAGQPQRASAELRAALALERGEYESAIAIAKDLDAAGQGTEAGELLASAAQLDPKSNWLFETRVRRLLAQGESATAIEMLRQRPLAARWTAQSRDTLLASALEQRAAEEAKAGETAAAVAGLEAAVALAPRDAWLRYRLAGYYKERGDAARGRDLMSAGVEAAPGLPEMRYAQALYLSQIDEYREALSAIEAVEAARRTEGMSALEDRVRVVLARAEARRRAAAGELSGARAALLAVESAASRSFDRARELAYSWIELGDVAHGIALVQPYVTGQGAHDAHLLIGWAQVLNSAEDDERLRAALVELDALPRLAADEHTDVTRLKREHDMRGVRALERQKNYAEAARRLDALLAAEPQDRQLRVARAELELAAGEPRRARDRLASLAAEDPDDLDTRLSYVRALTECGDTALARAQLEAVAARMPGGAGEELELSLARRQLGLGDSAQALHTLEPLLKALEPRADALMLAARAELAQGHLRQARDYFDRAAAATTGPEQLAARRASADVAERLQSSVTAGLIGWHQPGDPGMSQLDLYTLPSSWVYARADGSRVIARADAVWVDAGSFSTAAGSLPLLGTIQAAGPGATLRHTSGQQTGLSPAIGYQAGALTMDIGATPLGFLITNVVGGIEWTPKWRSLDLTFGVARRAVSSSELSYAGLRDPISGASWGGIVKSGPYAGFGVYREGFDVSGSVRFEELTGTRVETNRLAAARLSASLKFYSTAEARADAGVTVNYWSYEHNLQNYTFGSGGYYSPHSYVSLATPIVVEGTCAGWTYKARAGVSYTLSQVSANAFYPDDAALQARGAGAPLPAGYSTPYFAGYHSDGFGFSAYAAAEHQVSRGLVAGVLLDIDRTDYYHPTSIGVYLRHAFGADSAHVVSPPRPIGPYNP